MTAVGEELGLRRLQQEYGLEEQARALREIHSRMHICRACEKALNQSRRSLGDWRQSGPGNKLRTAFTAVSSDLEIELLRLKEEWRNVAEILERKLKYRMSSSEDECALWQGVYRASQKHAAGLGDDLKERIHSLDIDTFNAMKNCVAMQGKLLKMTWKHALPPQVLHEVNKFR